MHNALAMVARVEIGEAEIARIAVQRVNLSRAFPISDGQAAIGGGNIMIHHRQRQVRTAHRFALQAQALKSQRAGHFVHEVAVDVEQRRAAFQRAHHMRVPHLVVQRSRHGDRPPFASTPGPHGPAP